MNFSKLSGKIQTNFRLILHNYIVLNHAGDPDKSGQKRGKGGFSSILDSLVTAETITQDQADAVQSLFANKIRSSNQ